MHEIIHSNCLEAMKAMADNSLDFCVTDPPYGLKFMGKKWDYDVPNANCWKELLRILKPGAMIAVFAGSRTYHRMVLNIEDAGFEIRDCIMWIYSQGFPKSHNFGCKCKGLSLPYNHEKTTKSSSESSLRLLPETNLSSSFATCSSKDEIMFESLSQQNIQTYRSSSQCGNENGKEPRMEGRNNIQEEQRQLHRPEICQMSSGIFSNGKERRICDGTQIGDGQTSQQNITENRGCSSQGSQHKEQCTRESRAISEQSNTQTDRMGTCEKCGGLIGFEGYGTALKPAHEPICLAMKPLDGTFAQNAEKWGVAGLNIDECRIPANDTWKQKCHDIRPNGLMDKKGRLERISESSSKGRWPANVIFDEEAAQELDRQSGASRFFYCAKASSSERNAGLEGMPLKNLAGHNKWTDCDYRKSNGEITSKGQQNHHPTVKPLALIRYIIKLLAPPGKPTLIDPFAGSGTTIVAAKELGISAIGIEKEAEYVEISRKRIENAQWIPEQFELPLTK